MGVRSALLREPLTVRDVQAFVDSGLTDKRGFFIVMGTT